MFIPWSQQNIIRNKIEMIKLPWPLSDLVDKISLARRLDKCDDYV